MPKANGYCLKNLRTSELLTYTFAPLETDCWAASFDYLYANHKWMARFWKHWDESIKEAKKHGFIMVPVHLSEVKKKQ